MNRDHSVFQEKIISFFSFNQQCGLILSCAYCWLELVLRWAMWPIGLLLRLRSVTTGIGTPNACEVNHLIDCATAAVLLSLSSNRLHVEMRRVTFVSFYSLPYNNRIQNNELTAWDKCILSNRENSVHMTYVQTLDLSSRRLIDWLDKVLRRICNISAM